MKRNREGQKTGIPSDASNDPYKLFELGLVVSFSIIWQFSVSGLLPFFYEKDEINQQDKGSSCLLSYICLKSEKIFFEENIGIH